MLQMWRPFYSWWSSYAAHAVNIFDLRESFCVAILVAIVCTDVVTLSILGGDCADDYFLLV